MELIGVVPSIDTMENATPTDIIKRPTVKRQILLIITLNICYIFFKSTASPVMR